MSLYISLQSGGQGLGVMRIYIYIYLLYFGIIVYFLYLGDEMAANLGDVRRRSKALPGALIMRYQGVKGRKIKEQRK